jgi:hypothetical protein
MTISVRDRITEGLDPDARNGGSYPAKQRICTDDKRSVTVDGEQYRPRGHPMFKVRKAESNRSFEKMAIAFEYAIARRWARAHPLILRDKNRSTAGEMVPSPMNTDESGAI